MPLISLATNVKFESDDAIKGFVADFSKLCAKTIGKDEKSFSIDFTYNAHLMFAGTFEPAIVLSTMSLDNTNPTNVQLWSRAFADYFEAELGVPSDRGHIAFLDPGPAFIGTMGSTVQALRAAAPT